jgi:hypothetical protein
LARKALSQLHGLDFINTIGANNDKVPTANGRSGHIVGKMGVWIVGKATGAVGKKILSVMDQEI